MIIDQSHRRCIWFTLASSILVMAIYFLTAPQTTGAYGSSIPGLTFGIIAYAIMIFAALIGMRRRYPQVRVGRMNTWLKGHIWLSLLLFPLVFTHARFEWGSFYTGLLWILFVITMGSGLYGILAQQFMPRLMTQFLPLETICDQIPLILDQLRFEADNLVVDLTGPLGFEIPVPEGFKAAKVKEVTADETTELFKKNYLEALRPALLNLNLNDKKFKSEQSVTDLFGGLKLIYSENFHKALGRLEEIFKERTQMRLQTLLDFWLHGWLWIHIPSSIILIVLVGVHAAVALYY